MSAVTCPPGLLCLDFSPENVGRNLALVGPELVEAVVRSGPLLLAFSAVSVLVGWMAQRWLAAERARREQAKARGLR